MSDILFIGKDLPDSIDFAEGLASINRNVFTSTKDETEAENFAAENIFSATWNKTSAISARSFLIKAETKFPDINEYLFYFDSYYYSTKFELDKTEYVTAATDSLISSYQLFINELLYRQFIPELPLQLDFFHAQAQTDRVPSFNGAPVGSFNIF